MNESVHHDNDMLKGELMLVTAYYRRLAVVRNLKLCLASLPKWFAGIFDKFIDPFNNSLTYFLPINLRLSDQIVSIFQLFARFQATD